MKDETNVRGEPKAAWRVRHYVQVQIFTSQVPAPSHQLETALMSLIVDCCS